MESYHVNTILGDLKVVKRWVFENSGSLIER